MTVTRKDAFSMQVFQEHALHNGELTLLECLENMRESHGLEPHEVKKLITPNLYKELELEASKANTIETELSPSLNEWF